MVKHFKKVSKEIGYDFLPPEQLLNELGYGFMGIKLLDKSYQCLKLNIELYPQSYNVYDTMGEYYKTIGEKEKAIEMFEKSLAIKENGYIRDKIKDLKQK